jgi:hypothetical protein
VKKLAVARLTAGVALLLTACSRNIDNGEAVRQGVIDYLKARTADTGLNVDLMQVDVTSVSFMKDEARATVYFRPKGASNQGGMQMNYTLDRKGNQWVVRGRSGGSGSPHPGVNPPGVNPQGGAATPDLPPGHPSGASPAGALPPGHPSVGSKQ